MDLEKLMDLILEADNLEEALSNINGMTEEESKAILKEVAKDRFQTVEV